MNPAPELPTENSQEGQSRLLTSWKEIADFLGVSTKTAQQYEKLRALPVQRLGNRVRILESDLVAWQQSSTTTMEWWLEPRFLKTYSLAATALLALIAVGTLAYYWVNRPGQTATISWQGSLLTAFDSQGHPTWRHQFPYPLFDLGAAAETLTPWIGDPDGDGKNDVILAYSHIKRESDGWEVYCISPAGEVRWRLSPTRLVRNAKNSYKPPYVVRSFTVFPSPEKDGTFWTAAAFVHRTDSVAVILVADGKGKQRGEFWHMGHLNAIRAIDLDGDGKQELVAAGVQHGADQAVLLVLDPSNVRGAGQLEPPDSPMQLTGMEKGTETKVVYFPRTQLNQETGGFNMANELNVVEDTLQVSIYEHFTNPIGYLIYTLNRALEVQSVTASSSYGAAYQQVAKLQSFHELTPEKELFSLKGRVRITVRLPQ